MASMVSRPRYTTAKSSAAAAASVPHRTRRDDDRDRCGMATTRLSPFMAANEARHVVQRLRWSSISTRRLPVSSPLR